MDAYVARCGRRLRRVAGWRLAAGALVGAAGVTAGFAGAVVYWVPAPEWDVVARVLLGAGLLSLGVAAWRLRPRLRAPVARIERNVPAFGGRLATWADAQRRGRRSAVVDLLEAQTAAIAADHPPRTVVPAARLAAPAAFSFVCIAVLAWLLAAAPTPWQLASQRLWTGALFEDRQPRVVVEPGNVVVPRGADVVVRARPWGFEPGAMQLNAAFASGAGWERADMSEGAEGRSEFVLVAVHERVEYYVSAGGLNSARYAVEVADLPVVEGLTLEVTWPAWTGIAARRQETGDVRGVDGTDVAVQATTDLPFAAAHLVVDGEAGPMQVDGRTGNARFEIVRNGSWHLAVLHEGALVRITDEFGIDLAVDDPPEVEFAFPGRDRSVTAIEELALRFRARDDFGVEHLTLHYSVNGAAAVPKDLLVESGADVTGRDVLPFETLAVAEGDAERALRPGDVVAFFAEARDRGQRTRSALYFADVRPFDMRYREQQATSSGGGGGPGVDIAARQRDLVSATWNLIRQRDSGARAERDLGDRADVLALLQGRLMEQIDTLIERSEGRGLSASAEIDVFVTELARAREVMAPAAERLSERALDEALPLEQKALQHALAAEAGLRERNVSLASDDGSGEGAADRSLSELIDLEMDPERNRYEVPRAPGAAGEDAQEDAQWQRLAELARRQEALARQLGHERMPVSRWRQERLKRELEEARERLSRAGGGRSGRIDEALERLGEASDAIDESLRRDRPDPAAQARVGAALRDAAQRLREAGRERRLERVQEAHRTVDDLARSQQGINERLRALQDRSLGAARQGRRLVADYFEMQVDGQRKRRMQQDLVDTVRDLEAVRGALAERDRGALGRALDDVSGARLAERMAAAAEVFESGRPLFLVGQEDFVLEVLERFAERLGRIAERLAREGPRGADPSRLAVAQQLRRELAQAAGRGDVAAMERIARAVSAMEGEVLQPADAPDLSRDRADYAGLGAAHRNAQRLQRMTLERLDRVEVALAGSGDVTIRAEEPRDDAYDSAEVARYFRQLSCGGECE